MKPRWTVLFWCVLATLIGFAWLAARFGLNLTSLMNVGLFGMIAGSILSFIAMTKAMRVKWPAAITLACAGPMALDVLRSLPDLPMFISYIGIPGVLVFGGTIATVTVAVVILAMPIPHPPKDDPVPAARVVD